MEISQTKANVVPLHEGLPVIENIAIMARDEYETLRVCDVVALAAEKQLGWRFTSGQYRGPDLKGPFPTSYHCWNVLPDGTIVDATANQFSKDEPMPRVVPLNDPRRDAYIFWS